MARRSEQHSRRPSGEGRYERAHRAVRRDAYRDSESYRGNESRRPPKRTSRNPRDTYRDSYGDDMRVSARRGRRGMSFSASIVAALFFAFVLVYMAGRAYGFFTPTIATQVVRMGNASEQGYVMGLIVRYETLFYAERDGRVHMHVPDFERVREGDLVASVQDVAAVERLMRYMAELEDDIVDIHEMRVNTQVDPTIQRLNNNIRNLMAGSINHFSQTSVAEVYSLLENLNQLTSNRRQITTSETGGSRTDLSNLHESLQSQLEYSSNDIETSVSGVVSPYLDYHSGSLSYHDMLELSAEDTRRVIDHAGVVAVREVSEGEPVFKVIGNTWYVVAFIPNEMAQGINPRANMTIYLENANTGRFEPMTMHVYSVEYRGRERQIIFRSNRNVIEFSNQRNVRIRTTDNVQTGLHIPTSAITEQRFYSIPLSHVHVTGTDIYHLSHRAEGGVTSRPVLVDVYRTSDTHAYIMYANMPLNMMAILTPVDEEYGSSIILNQEHISIVYGVYRTNLGFADFRQIRIDRNYIPEYLDYVILDPSIGQGIRLFDTIVVDASTVHQGKVLNQ